MTIEIRAERTEDFREVYELTRSAFDSDVQANLVSSLRTSADPYISLVAVTGNEIIGHILFSPVTVVANPDVRAAQLSPVSVLPEKQGQGVGAALIQAGHEASREIWVASFLVGDPRYYKNFGYELVAGRFCTGGPHDPALQLCELVPGSLKDLDGKVLFHSVFREIEEDA